MTMSKIHSARSIVFLLLVVALLIPPGTAKTNLFNGFFKREQEGLIDDVKTAALSNKEQIPLIGLGVGNLQKNMIEDMVYQGLKANHRIRLIDTAHASHNEGEIAKGIVEGVQRFRDAEKLEGRVQVHVVTKVWYTYLGYERTKISVLESFEALKPALTDKNVDLRVHVLIHWPRCFSAIPWMKCEEEEEALPQSVKDAGPPPHQDKLAWKQSWKALEDMYNSGDYPFFAGIGVSNFSADDLDMLLHMAKTTPHIMQMNVWSLLNDPHLVDLCNKKGILLQVYNVMNGILKQSVSAPHSYHHLLQVANEITKKSLPEGSEPITAGQVVLRWLVQYGISVIPRTSSKERLEENSAVAVSRIPDLTEAQQEIVAHAMESMLAGDDMEEDVNVQITFHAKTQSMYLYWFKDEETVKQIAYIEKGDWFDESTHPNHKFRLYHSEDPETYQDYVVEANYGDHETVHIEL